MSGGNSNLGRNLRSRVDPNLNQASANNNPQMPLARTPVDSSRRGRGRSTPSSHSTTPSNTNANIGTPNRNPSSQNVSPNTSSSLQSKSPKDPKDTGAIRKITTESSNQNQPSKEDEAQLVNDLLDKNLEGVNVPSPTNTTTNLVSYEDYSKLVNHVQRCEAKIKEMSIALKQKSYTSSNPALDKNSNQSINLELCYKQPSINKNSIQGNNTELNYRNPSQRKTNRVSFSQESFGMKEFTPDSLNEIPGQRNMLENNFSSNTNNNLDERNIRSSRINHGSSRYELDSSEDDYALSRQHGRRSYVKCEMHRWRIRFSGGNGIKFFKKVEKLQESYEYDDETVLKHFHELLDGHALEWYWQHIIQDNICRLSHLKQMFINAFQPRLSDMEILSDMYGTVQESNFEDYYKEMMKLNDSREKPLEGAELIEILRRNSSDEVRKRILAFSTDDPIKFHKMAKKADDDATKERNKQKRKPYQEYRAPPPRKISEIDFNTFSQLEIEEISTKLNHWKSQKEERKCYNCHTSGHLVADCPEKVSRIFCFKCGLDGYITPQCPTCSPKGNRSVD